MTTPREALATYATQSQMSSFFIDKMGIYSVKSYGAIGDGASDDRTAVYNAVTAAAVNGGSVFFPAGTYLIGSDLTVPANVTLWFPNGAQLSVSAGVTVTINGPIEAGPSQIFSGTGTVTGAPIITKIYPQWWGAKGDGVTGDTAAIQAAFNFAKALNTYNGVEASFPIGVYVTTDELEYNKSGINIRGSGKNNTIIYNKSSKTTLNLGATGSRADHNTIKDIQLAGTSDSLYGLWVEGSHNVIDNCEITGHGEEGLVLNKAWTNTVTNNYIHANKNTGVLFDDETNNVVFSGNEIASNNGKGILIKGCRNLRIFGNGIEANDDAGIVVMGSAAQANRSNMILGNYFEGNCVKSGGSTDAYEIVVDRDGNEISNIIIDGNYFDSTTVDQIYMKAQNSGYVANNFSASVKDGGEMHNVAVFNNQAVNYSSDGSNSQYSAYMSVNGTNGLRLEGRLPSLHMARSNAGSTSTIFYVKSDGNSSNGAMYLNGHLTLTALSSDAAPANSVYRNSADGKLTWKDNSSASNPLY